MNQTSPDQNQATNSRARPLRPSAALALILCLALGLILGAAARDLEHAPSPGIPPVMTNLDAAQVDQPVTAVLLNFRAYDTWLEVGVLAVVTIGVLALRRAHGLPTPYGGPVDPVLNLVSRVLLPFMVLVSGFLLWAGTHSPGGAFQAGAVLGAGAVLLRVAGITSWLDRLMHGPLLRVLALVGFLCFLIFATLTLVAGRGFLEYPPGLGASLIFAIETAVTISIGWTLAFLYMGATPPGEDVQRSSQSASTS